MASIMETTTKIIVRLEKFCLEIRMNFTQHLSEREREKKESWLA